MNNFKSAGQVGASSSNERRHVPLDDITNYMDMKFNELNEAVSGLRVTLQPYIIDEDIKKETVMTKEKNVLREFSTDPYNQAVRQACRIQDFIDQINYLTTNLEL